ncbi:MAG: hypothetical protein WBA93_11630 [Microcoleaceae cyanobacterium]
MEDLTKILEFIKSLGGGGIFGSGLLGLTYLLWPGLFPPAVPLEIILIIGSLFGAGCHRLLDSLAIAIAKNQAYNLEESRKQKRLVEKLRVLKKCEVYGYISPSKVSEIKEELLTDFLLPESERRQISGDSED